MDQINWKNVLLSIASSNLKMKLMGYVLDGQGQEGLKDEEAEGSGGGVAKHLAAG